METIQQETTVTNTLYYQYLWIKLGRFQYKVEFLDKDPEVVTWFYIELMGEWSFAIQLPVRLTKNTWASL